jgi:hypothetical protein
MNMKRSTLFVIIVICLSIFGCGEDNPEWRIISTELVSKTWSGQCEATIVGDVQVGCIEYGYATYTITEQRLDEIQQYKETRVIRRACECEQWEEF